MPRAVIAGTGHYVPPQVITNDDLAQQCDTSDAWIRERTGIEERRYIAPGQTTSELGLLAARRALESAQRTAKEIDCLIFATLSADYCFPGAGCLVQASLGIPGVPAFDVRNQCSGFLYGLQMATAFIEAGVYRRVLLIGAEVHSTGLDFSRNGRDVTVLFGDGAGAVVLEASSSESSGVLSVKVGADGRYARALWCEGPASAPHPRRVDAEMLERGIQYPKMNGREVFRHAVRRMKQELEALLIERGMQTDELSMLIPHQANLRIAERLRQMLSLSPEQVFNNIQRYGNTTAASIPIALDECVRAGRLAKGDVLGLVAFGSGFTWGAALLRW